MRRLSSSTPVCRRGFSLIEMLVVVTIIVMLLALATPALTRTMQSSQLAAAGEALLGAIAEAQQAATATNTPVEMRFFSFKDSLDQVAMYHSYQLFKITTQSNGGGAGAAVTEAVVPLENLVRLPDSIIIPMDITLSNAFYDNNGINISLPDTKAGSQVGYSGVSQANYCAIRFLPDGTCRTVGATNNGVATMTFQYLAKNFITLTFGSGSAVTLSNLPGNFVTIQIDPYTGKARSYKPGF